METKLGAQHVQAMRIFRVRISDLILMSTSVDEAWNPGEIKQAKCLCQRRSHEKPTATSTCGIWSGNSLRIKLSLHYFYVSAQIQQWGVVIEHEWGYRSEYGRIIPATISPWPRAKVKSPTVVNLIQHLRDKYSA